MGFDRRVNQGGMGDIEAGNGAVVHRADDKLPQRIANSVPIMECSRNMNIATNQEATADSLVANEIKNRFPFIMISFPIVHFRVLFIVPNHARGNRLEGRGTGLQFFAKPIPLLLSEAGGLGGVRPTGHRAAEPAWVEQKDFQGAKAKRGVNAATFSERTGLLFPISFMAKSPVGSVFTKCDPRHVLAGKISMAIIDPKVMVVPRSPARYLPDHCGDLWLT